jgi:hypothetical protein
MSRTAKLANKAKLSKRTKGSTAGKDTAAKMKCPHQQSKASWMTSKGGKAKGSKK